MKALIDLTYCDVIIQRFGTLTGEQAHSEKATLVTA
jgi:hypothetical protein